jgi:hypothetical protein
MLAGSATHLPVLLLQPRPGGFAAAALLGGGGLATLPAHRLHLRQLSHLQVRARAVIPDTRSVPRGGLRPVFCGSGAELEVSHPDPELDCNLN